MIFHQVETDVILLHERGLQTLIKVSLRGVLYPIKSRRTPMTDTRQTLNLRIWEHETEIMELDRKIQALQDKRLSLTLELATLDIELVSLEV